MRRDRLEARVQWIERHPGWGLAGLVVLAVGAIVLLNLSSSILAGFLGWPLLLVALLGLFLWVMI